MKHTLQVIAVLAATALVSGCASGAAGGGALPPLTPTSRFSLQVEPGLERIALAVHENGLSGNQQSALADMIDRFLIEGAPVLRVEAPSGNDPVAGDFAWRVRGALEARGAPGHRIQVVAYNAPDPRAPVLVSYETLRAAVPQCGTHWTSVTRTNANEPTTNFGCAVTANLAAQIANPRDIVQPRGMTPGDAGRRTVVFDHYRKGEATAAPQEDLVANRRVSQAVD